MDANLRTTISASRDTNRPPLGGDIRASKGATYDTRELQCKAASLAQEYSSCEPRDLRNTTTPPVVMIPEPR